jgi:protein TonB
MFEESLVESTSLLRSRNRWPAIFSFALQAAIVSALVTLPLLHPEILPVSVPKLLLFAPPLKPPTPPPVQPVRVETSGAATTVAAPMQAARISRAFTSDGQAVDQPALAVGMTMIGAGQSPLSVLGSLGPAGPHVVVDAAPGKPAGLLNVSTGVMEGRLLEPILPQYPAIARISYSEGTVVVKAIISKTGKIESAHVVSGPAILQSAALDAVRDARYRPFLLNNQPTEVETTISIVFRLGS